MDDQPSPRPEKSDAPSISVATAADKQAVLTIDSGYDELDYLPDLYDELISGQGVKGFVLRKSPTDNTVIGFLSTLIVDGGKTVASKAGRIRPDHRGSGLYGRFTSQIFLRHLGVPNTTMAVNAVNMAKFTNQFSSKYCVSHSQVTLYYKIYLPAVIIHQNIQQDVSPEKFGLRELTLSNFELFLRNDPKAVFPDGRFIVHFYPFRVMAENAQVLFNSGSRRKLYTSGVDFSEDGTTVTFQEETMQAFSCGSHYLSPSHILSYHLVLYGGATSEACLENHLRWHIHRLLDLSTTQSRKDLLIVRLMYQRDVRLLMERLERELGLRMEVMDEVFRYSPMRILDRTYE